MMASPETSESERLLAPLHGPLGLPEAAQIPAPAEGATVRFERLAVKYVAFLERADRWMSQYPVEQMRVLAGSGLATAPFFAVNVVGRDAAGGAYRLVSFEDGLGYLNNNASSIRIDPIAATPWSSENCLKARCKRSADL